MIVRWGEGSIGYGTLLCLYMLPRQEHKSGTSTRYAYSYRFVCRGLVRVEWTYIRRGDLSRLLRRTRWLGDVARKTSIEGHARISTVQNNVAYLKRNKGKKDVQRF